MCDGFDSPFAGPGIGPTIGIGEEVGFVVNTKGAGKGKVSCIVITPDGTEVEAEVIENEDGTFDIFYTAPKPGTYVIHVLFGGENIPHSPFKVMVRNRSKEQHLPVYRTCVETLRNGKHLVVNTVGGFCIGMRWSSSQSSIMMMCAFRNVEGCNLKYILY